MRARILGSTLVVVVLGSLLHFAHEWSGRNGLVAVFAAVNESTWEHLKLAFWPALFLAPVQRRLYGAPPGFLPATAIRCSVPSLLIVGLFYGYTALLGTHHLVADIGTFVVAVFLGELAGHAVMGRPTTPAARAGSTMVLLGLVVAFATLTFRPLSWFLFEDPAGAGAHDTNRSP